MAVRGIMLQCYLEKSLQYVEFYYARSIRLEIGCSIP